MDLDRIRRDGEASLAGIMAKLDERHRALLREALRQYGSAENIPPAVWQEITRETEENTVAAMLMLLLGGSAYTSWEIERQGHRMADATAGDLASSSLVAAKQANAAAIQSAESIQRRLVQSLQKARLSTLGGVGELTDAGIDKALDEVFTAQRRETTAANETTRAITNGQRGAAIRAGQSVTVEMRWQTERDSLVCPRCAPLHEQPEEVWSLVFSEGPGQEAHPNCRCWLRAVVIVEAAKGAA